jgi:hypothetical protein
MSDDEVLRHWSTVAGAWESYRDRLFTDVRSVSDWLLDAVDPQPGQTVLELATVESNQALAAAGGFTDAIVDELTGTMRFDDLDDYWTHITAVAGPVAELVDSLEPDRVDAVRSTLGPSIEPFEREGALEIPWTATVTRMG